MPKREGSMGVDATVLQKAPDAMSTEAAKTRHEAGTASESPKTAATAGPTKSEIAGVAYQLWLDNGCTVGSDQEDWFRAEAMLKNARVAKREDLSRLPSTPHCNTRTESEMLVEFRWEGHWEIWDMEWPEAHWVWD